MLGSPSVRLIFIISSTAVTAAGWLIVEDFPSAARTDPPVWARNWVSVCIDQVSSWYIGSLMKLCVHFPDAFL